MTEPQAFAGDSYLEAEIARLIHVYGIVSAVETGTHVGATTQALAAMVPEVHTIEINPGTFASACLRLAGTGNVHQFCGSSAEVLPALLPVITHPTLYYLDAHWDGQYPLPQEIQLIAHHDPSPIIVMHDMSVPGHPGLHADPQPSGAPYDFEWVRPFLAGIKEPWRHYYNSEAEGLKVGVMFVVPDIGRAPRRPYGQPEVEEIPPCA